MLNANLQNQAGLRILIFLTIFILFSCIDNNHLKAWDITKRIQPLIDAKASHCGNRPQAILFFTREASIPEVEACERDIIAKSCPFRFYPWSCVRIF